MNKVLLTGGRAPATLDLARMLRSEGCEIQIAESIPMCLAAWSNAVRKCHRVPPPRQAHAEFVLALLKIIQEEEIDVLIPTCEEIYHVVKAEGELRKQCLLFAPSFEEILSLHSKWRFNQWMSELGLSVPKTERFLSPDGMRSHVLRHGSETVYKPEWSRFAVYVQRSPADGEWVDNAGCGSSNPWLAQQRIVGQEFCTYSWFQAGRCVASACYPMQFNSSTGASLRFEHVSHPAITKWIAEFGEKTQITGQCAFDFIEDADGIVYAIECNPRLTSGIHTFDSTTALLQNMQAPDPDLITPGNTLKALKPLLLMYAWKEIRDNGFSAWWRTLWGANDVFFRWRDLKPAFLWTLSIIPFVFRAIRLNITPMQSSTWDIEWNGEDALEDT